MVSDLKPAALRDAGTPAVERFRVLRFMGLVGKKLAAFSGL
jgi:hypothetical protein